MSEEIKEPTVDPGWSNERIGQEVRDLAKYLLGKEIPGFTEVRIMASIINLLGGIESTNAGKLEMTLSGYGRVDSSERRDYQVIVREVGHIDEIIQEKNDLLQECLLQLEYLDKKFTSTGTTASVIARLQTELQKK